MPLYILNKILPYDYLIRNFHPGCIDDKPKEVDESLRSQILKAIKNQYQVYTSEVILSGWGFSCINIAYFVDLPRPVHLVTPSHLESDCQIVLNCSEDELVQLSLTDPNWLSEGYKEISKDYFDQPRIRGI